VNIPGKVTVNEADVFSRGSTPFAFSIREFRIGIGICFDVRFPQIAIDYAVKDDCNVLIFPSAFTAVTGPLHWKLLGCARAIDTQCYVAMVSSSYDEQRVFKGHGCSFVADPLGKNVGEIGNGPGILAVELSLENVTTARASLPVLVCQKEDLQK
jgi:omega-amidase